MQKLFFSILGFLVVVGATAQKHAYGLKAGGGMARWVEVDAWNKVWGGTFGGMYSYQFNDYKGWALQTELNYELKGAESPYSGRAVRQHYLSVPLLLQYHVQEDGPYLYAGGYAARQLGVIVEENMAFISLNDINTIDAGLSWGIGIRFHAFGTYALLIDSRYSVGLTSVYTPTGITPEGTAYEVEHTTRFLSISVGVVRLPGRSTPHKAKESGITR